MPGLSEESWQVKSGQSYMTFWIGCTCYCRGKPIGLDRLLGSVEQRLGRSIVQNRHSVDSSNSMSEPVGQLNSSDEESDAK